MLLFVELFRNAITHFYPETALFDRGSELETFIFRVWQITWITSATWLLIRVVFPAAHRSLVRFYNDFETHNFREEERQKFSLRMFLVFFLGLVLLLSGRASTEPQVRKNLLDTLRSQLHVRELTGNNDGVEVERYLNFVGRQKGDAWCAAFASYNLYAVGVTKPVNPVSAWAPSFANPKYVVYSQSLVKAHKAKKPKPGDLFTLYYTNLNRVGHVGFIVGESGNYYITTEGNTGTSGTREGAGVHSLKRSKLKVYAVSNYITPYINNHEKTSFVPDLNSLLANVLQNNEVVGNARKGNCEQRFNSPSGGLDSLQGFSFKCERFAVSYRCDSKARRSGQGEPFGDHNRVGTFQSVRFDYRWKTESRLPMQRLGNKSKATGAVHKGLAVKKERQGTYKNCYRSKGSPIYPEMG